MEKDVFLKDEGDMLTVGFVTDKAKAALTTQPIEVTNLLYGGQVRKLDIDRKSKRNMISFLLSHDLSFDLV